MERVPTSAIAADNCLYLRPLLHSNDDLSKPWFSTQCVGKYTLSAMVKEVCAEVGITGKTNHSLQATGATTMFNAGVLKKVIQEKTGHLLLVHTYIHTLVQLNLGEISPAVPIKHSFPQILPIFSLHATVLQDGVWISLLSPHATPALCFGLPH